MPRPSSLFLAVPLILAACGPSESPTDASPSPPVEAEASPWLHEATVELGLSFWGYVAFSILFTLAIAALDRYQLWQEIEELEAARG